MKYLGILFISVSVMGQGSMDQIKLDIYSNPHNVVNQNYIRLLNAHTKLDIKEEYLFDKWVTMEVEGKEKEILKIDSANYHIPTDRILFFKDNIMYQLFPDLVDRLQVGGKEFKSEPFLKNNKRAQEKGYFEILVEGPITLLKKYNVERKEVNSNPLGLQEGKSVQMIQSHDLYYLNNSKAIAERIPGKKLDVAKLFGRHRLKMIAFAEERNLSVKTEKDLVLIFRYYKVLEQNEN